ncbi:MAG: VOC family protein [Pseudomonadota bacterium]
MRVELQHVHIFASDMEATIGFWREMFGMEVLIDVEVAGNRSVMLGLGSGRLAIYDRPPREGGSGGAIHHLGLQTDDLDALMAHMEAQGFRFTESVRDVGYLRFIFAPAPDGILLDLFQIIPEKIPEDIRSDTNRAFTLDNWV